MLSKAKVFPFDTLPVATNDNGESRKVLLGVLPTGEAVEMHETSLLAGHMPHPAHRHRHSEFMLVREGSLEFQNNGKPQSVGPGGAIFAASGMLHGLRNAGDTVAQYFVVAIGREEAPAGKAAAMGWNSGVLAESNVFALDEMPVRKMANGGESRDFVHGALATGEAVRLHASVLPAGVAPNPMHVINHSELIMVREGTISFEHLGKSQRVGPGGVIFVAPGTNHMLRNVGEGAAKYFVLGIGGDVKG